VLSLWLLNSGLSDLVGRLLCIRSWRRSSAESLLGLRRSRGSCILDIEERISFVGANIFWGMAVSLGYFGICKVSSTVICLEMGAPFSASILGSYVV
jgi:hypothetical protein